MRCRPAPVGGRARGDAHRWWLPLPLLRLAGPSCQSHRERRDRARVSATSGSRRVSYEFRGLRTRRPSWTDRWSTSSTRSAAIADTRSTSWSSRRRCRGTSVALLTLDLFPTTRAIAVHDYDRTSLCAYANVRSIDRAPDVRRTFRDARVDGRGMKMDDDADGFSRLLGTLNAWPDIMRRRNELPSLDRITTTVQLTAEG